MGLSASDGAAAITAAQGAATNPAIQNAANLAIATGIANWLNNHLSISSTIPATSINTSGGPAAQVGPPAPVTITGSVA